MVVLKGVDLKGVGDLNSNFLHGGGVDVFRNDPTFKTPRLRPKKKICGFPVSSYKNLGRVGRF
jgi:hypothetical protein